MNDMKFVYDISGFDELRKSPEMKEMLREAAQCIANRAGTGFAAEVKTGATRCYATVTAETDEAFRACLEDDVLVRALKGGS